MTLSQAKTEILSGLTVSIALVPEAISFAMLAGAAPQAGLWAAFFMAISSALFGGRPGIISGATGATAVILAGSVSTNGVDAIPTTVAVAGLIQLIVWITPLWKAFQFIPKAALSGFLVALAIMIISSQDKYFQIGSPDGNTFLLIALGVSLSLTAMVWSSQRFSFPPALSALAVGCIIGIPFGLATVSDISPVTSTLPVLSIPDFSLFLAVLPYSFGMAVSGLLESLLTVDSISHRLNEHGDKKKEVMAQGIGNVVSGFFSTIGGCVLVGQSILNVSSGAKHRLSSITAALGLAFIILFLSTPINHLPLIGLIAIMLVVGFETGDWKSIVSGSPLNISIVVLTALVSVLTRNLAVGAIFGTLVYWIAKKFYVSHNEA